MKLAFDRTGELLAGLYFQIMPLHTEKDADRFFSSPTTASSPWRGSDLRKLQIPRSLDNRPDEFIETCPLGEARDAVYVHPTIYSRYDRLHFDAEESREFLRYFDRRWTDLGRRTIFQDFEICDDAYRDLVSIVPIAGACVVPKMFFQTGGPGTRGHDKSVEVGCGRVAAVQPLVGDAFVPWVIADGQPRVPDRKFWPLTGMPINTPWSPTESLQFDAIPDYVVDGRYWHGEDMLKYTRYAIEGRLISRRLAAAVRHLGLGPIVLRNAYVRMDGITGQARRLAEEWLRIDLPMSSTESLVFVD